MNSDDEQRIRRNAEGGWEVSGIYANDVVLLLEAIDHLRQIKSALLEAVKRIVYEDEAGEITGGAIEDCKQAIEKAEAES